MQEGLGLMLLRRVMASDEKEEEIMAGEGLL